MKHNEIEQAVIELCDAVPIFTYGLDEDGNALAGLGAFTFYADSDELAAIAQHAKLWAAQQGWIPLICLFPPTHSLFLINQAAGKKTEWLEFDPETLGSEELQWIRAVTEVAKLITNQGAMK